jgi:RND family efflux transporter MFP subunit
MRLLSFSTGLLGLVLAGCGGNGRAPEPPVAAAETGQRSLTVQESTITATFEAAGVAEPIERAVLSTRLMGNVTAVLVREGDRVNRGQLLARLDAREIAARRAQVDAGIAAAEAVYADAQTQAGRFRSLYADSAATRAQLDQAETGLARAEAGLRTARASGAELEAVGDYAEIRAPFGGTVTRRFVDPGAFLAPGAPILEIQDGSRLRVSVSVPPRMGAALKVGTSLDARIEGRPVRAVLEGVVPVSGTAVYTVNAIVLNPSGEWLTGGSAVLLVADGERRVILVPASALIQEGDLTGVRVKTSGGTELRWVRTGSTSSGSQVEVLSGLRPGDVILEGGL